MRTSLETSARALRAQQLGLEVTSNNIANANTPGYTRQAAIISPSDPRSSLPIYKGASTVISSIKNFREENLDRDVRNAVSRQSGYAFDNATFKKIQTVLHEPSDYGIDSSFDAFFTSAEKLSSKPDDSSLRVNFLTQAKNLASMFSSSAQGLKDLREQVYSQMDSNVTTANRLIAGIADINAALNGATGDKDQLTATLVDKQNVLIEQLSKIANVTATRTGTGTVNISLNGSAVVTNDATVKLQLQRSSDPLSGENTASISFVDAAGNNVGTYRPNVGEIASQMRAYNVTLDDKELSSEFSVSRELNDLAGAFADAVNAVSVTGYGLDDAPGTPPGRALFASSDGLGINALNMVVNQDILDDVRKLPTASVGASPADNNIIRAIAQLTNDTTVMGGLTARESYSKTLTSLAAAGADSMNGQALSDATVLQIGSQRENISGVNMDEEAINMIKFQRAFEAAARMVSTTSEMMKSVINLGL